MPLGIERQRTRLDGLALDGGGRSPGFDVPVDLLAAVETERVEVEGADMRLVPEQLRTGGDVVDLTQVVVVRPFPGEGVRVTIGETEANDIFLKAAEGFRKEL